MLTLWLFSSKGAFAEGERKGSEGKGREGEKEREEKEQKEIAALSKNMNNEDEQEEVVKDDHQLRRDQIIANFKNRRCV